MTTFNLVLTAEEVTGLSVPFPQYARGQAPAVYAETQCVLYGRINLSERMAAYGSSLLDGLTLTHEDGKLIARW